MNSNTRLATTFVHLLVIPLWACVLPACATFAAPTQASVADLRGGALVGQGRPQRIVSGPTLLLHVDVADRGAVTLFSVPASTPGVDNCAGSTAAERTWVELAGNRPLNLRVPSGQTVCAVASPEGPRVEIAWHAHALDASMRVSPEAQLIAAKGR